MGQAQDAQVDPSRWCQRHRFADLRFGVFVFPGKAQAARAKGQKDVD
jgi:hypothetical protein